MSLALIDPNVAIHLNARKWRATEPDSAALPFHRTLPGYQPTRLISVPWLATELGVGHLYVKDESARFGLPAFKALGASWAIHKAIAKYAVAPGTVITTATDGNHGRAVARVSKSLGHPTRIFIPSGVSDFAINAIAEEGAQIELIDGDYDQAVAASAKYAADSGALLVQDTAWADYQEIPAWIVEGYSTMVAEVDEQLAADGHVADLVLVPTGVGSLLQAVIAHYRSKDISPTHVASVEPEEAAGVFESLLAEELISVATKTTIMAGLNCGTPSQLALPYIFNGLSAAVKVNDDEARRALNDLLAEVEVGPCGAASLVGARKLCASPVVREQLGLSSGSVVVLLSTESALANPI